MKKLLKLIVIILIFGLIGCVDPNPTPQPGPKEPGIIDTKLTDSLKLTHAYEGKSFKADGIGEVQLSQLVDGDTTYFKEASGQAFSTRYLGINTPESTGRVDPWGKAASAFVAEILSKATKFVLEAERISNPATLDTTGTRYLAYVWYQIGDADFRLLNLELIEECYSQSTLSDKTASYYDIFESAFKKSNLVARRIFGEKDPSFDYSNQRLTLTITEIKANFDNYSSGTKLLVKARVARLSGSNLYLEDLEESWNEEKKINERSAIYLFGGYNLGSIQRRVTIGTVIQFKCQVLYNDIYGKQLTNPEDVRIITAASGEDIVAQEPDLSKESLAMYEGFVVKLKGLIVTEVYKKDENIENSPYTVRAKDTNGNEVSLRIDGKPGFPYENIKVGDRIDIIGGVSQFHDYYQIVIGNIKDLAENDLIILK